MNNELQGGNGVTNVISVGGYSVVFNGILKGKNEQFFCPDMTTHLFLRNTVQT
jgi:hypothetical protein